MKYIGSKSLNVKIIELFVFVVCWMVIFSIPFFNNRFNNSVDWGKLFEEWIRISSYLIIFVINFYILVPLFLFKKRYRTYIGIAIILVICVTGISILCILALTPAQPVTMPPMDFGPGMPPMELGIGMPAPIGYKPVNLPQQKSIFMIIADELLISTLLVGAGTSIKMVTQWIKEENRHKDIEKQQLKNELAFLRHQVSPHFFMNTLNNIHALIDINTEDAKNTIIELSTMMRYLLYDTAQGHTTLNKEINFIESYIALMQLRFPKKVTVTLELPPTIPDIVIPPMLFISFLENSFKHGVSFQTESFVSFRLELTGDCLYCSIRNSNHSNKENIDKKYSGIGLTNIKKSLDLLFGKEYLLEIAENEKEFAVQLNIPVYENKMPGH